VLADLIIVPGAYDDPADPRTAVPAQVVVSLIVADADIATAAPAQVVRILRPS
jgi:hypothetical protein